MVAFRLKFNGPVLNTIKDSLYTESFFFEIFNRLKIIFESDYKVILRFSPKRIRYLTLNKLKKKIFWDFSLWIYRQDGVELSCLNLQNQYDCDVNLLFFCCWGGLRYGVIPKEIVNQAIEYSRKWRNDVVQPLRGIRIRMKGEKWLTAANDHEALRDRIKSSELEAERLQQAVLERLVGDLQVVQSNPATILDAIVENLNLYFQKAGIELDGAACENLVQILCQISPGHSPPSLDPLVIKN